MDRLDELLTELAGRSREVVLQPNEYFDFNLKDQVALIVEGDLLMIAPKDPKTGRSKRHTLKAKDPYGVAEAISSKTPDFECTVQTATKLRIFNGQEISFCSSVINQSSSLSHGVSRANSRTFANFLRHGSTSRHLPEWSQA